MFQRSTSISNARELTCISVTRQQPLLLPLEDSPPTSPLSRVTSAFGAMWTPTEHERFLKGLELFPSGLWKCVAEHIGSKTARQVMSHAQKYHQKIERRRRALEHQARERQPAENATGGAATKPLISAGTIVSVTMASALGSNSGTLRLECEPELNVVPGWDVTLQESILESFYNGKRSSDDDLNHQLFQQHMRDAGNLADQQLLHECAELLGVEVSSPPLVPWSLGGPFAFRGPGIGSLVSGDGGSMLEFAPPVGGARAREPRRHPDLVWREQK